MVEAVIGPGTIEVDLAVLSRRLEREMRLDILTLCIDIHVVGVADAESAVGILIVEVVGTWLVGEDPCMILFAVPAYPLQAHGGVRGVEGLKLMILVSTGEDKFAVMVPCHAVGPDILWLGVVDTVVPPSVLQHNGLDLRGWRRDTVGAEVETDAQLLVTVIDVDVRVCRLRHRALHRLFRHHETSLEHRRVVVILVIDRHRVVATEFQSAPVVGQCQSIMGVECVCVDRLCVVVDGVARSKAIDIVALQEFLRRCPVSLTMLDGVGVAMIVVGEFVESNNDIVVGRCEVDDGQRLHPVVVRDDLEGGDVRNKNLTALCLCSGTEQ